MNPYELKIVRSFLKVIMYRTWLPYLFKFPHGSEDIKKGAGLD